MKITLALAAIITIMVVSVSIKGLFDFLEDYHTTRIMYIESQRAERDRAIMRACRERHGNGNAKVLEDCHQTMLEMF